MKFSRVLKMRRKRRALTRLSFSPDASVDSLFTLAVLVMCVVAFATASTWPYEAAIMPQTVSALGIVSAAFALVGDWIRPIHLSAAQATDSRISGEVEEDQHYDLETDFGELPVRQILIRGGLYIVFLGVLGLLSWGIGVIAAIPLFLLAYMAANGERLKIVLTVTLGFWVEAYVLFDRLLQLAWSVPLIPSLF